MLPPIAADPFADMGLDFFSPMTGTTGELIGKIENGRQVVHGARKLTFSKN
jgi:hypothetical protein